MKKIVILLTILVIMPIFSLKTHAAELPDRYLEEFDSLLPDSLSGIGEDGGRLMDTVGIKGLIEGLLSAVSGNRGRISSFALTLLSALIFCSLYLFIPGESGQAVSVGSGMICSVLIFGSLSPIFSEICDSLDSLNDFFGSCIPIMAAVSALGGGSGAAAAQSGGMYTSLYIVSEWGGRMLRSFTSLGLALALLSPFCEAQITKVSGAVRGFFLRALGIMAALITAGFSLQTLVASAADGLAMRTVKHLTSGMIPLVGSTVSSALSTLASGLSYTKEIMGVGAIAAILLIVIAPLVTLLLHRLALSLAIGLSDMLGSSVSGIFSAYRFALDMMLALYALTGLIYVFEFIIFIKTGVAIL